MVPRCGVRRAAVAAEWLHCILRSYANPFRSPPPYTAREASVSTLSGYTLRRGQGTIETHSGGASRPVKPLLDLGHVSAMTERIVVPVEIPPPPMKLLGLPTTGTHGRPRCAE